MCDSLPLPSSPSPLERLRRRCRTRGRRSADGSEPERRRVRAGRVFGSSGGVVGGSSSGLGWDEDGERPLARSADVPLRCRRRVWEDFGESGPNLTLGAGEVVGDSGEGVRDEGSLRASSRASVERSHVSDYYVESFYIYTKSNKHSFCSLL